MTIDWSLGAFLCSRAMYLWPGTGISFHSVPMY